MIKKVSTKQSTGSHNVKAYKPCYYMCRILCRIENIYTGNQLNWEKY